MLYKLGDLVGHYYSGGINIMSKLLKIVLTVLLAIVYMNSGFGISTAKAIQDELTLALTPTAIKGLDPLVHTLANGVPLIQSTLLTTDKNLGITYDLADEYQVSNDKLTWEFKLRDDAYFSNGEKVKASDVSFSFNQAKYNGWIELSALKEAEVIDDYTVHFHLNRPQSTFAYTVTQLGVVPEKQYDEFYSVNPVGSGPYILEEWQEGEKAVFSRNENYYGEKSIFKRIKILFMDEEAAYAAAQKGIVDMAQTSPIFAKVGVDDMEIKAFKGIDQYGIAFAGLSSGTVDFSTQADSDISVRKAINLAIDRDQFINEILNGYGEAAYNDAERLPWGYKDEEAEYSNIEKAKEILKIDGWADIDGDGVLEKQGVQARLTLQFHKSDSVAQYLAKLLKQQLAELGIVVDLKSQKWAEISLSRYKDPVLMCIGSHNPMDLYHRYHTDNRGKEFYHTNLYSATKVDQLIEESLISGDFDTWQLTQRAIASDVPWIWLVNPEYLFFTKKGLNLGEPVLLSSEQPLLLLKNIEEWVWEE